MKQYCTLSATLFALVAVMHLVRAVNQWSFQLGPYSLPIWLSAVGGVVAASLSVWGFRLAQRR